MQTVPYDPERTPLREFDAFFAKVNDERGQVYGHPSDNFLALSKMKAAIEPMRERDPVLYEAACHVLGKLSRLITTPSHLDSWIDIAGYARVAAMILDRREQEKSK